MDVFLIRKVCCLCLICCCLCLMGADQNARQTTTKDPCSSTLRQYSSEVMERVKGKSKSTDKQTFYKFWVEQFQKALASTSGASQPRLRIFDELGALLVALGRDKEALKVFQKMEKVALEAGNKRASIISLQNQFGISQALLESKERIEIGSRCIKVLQNIMGEKEKPSEIHMRDLITMEINLGDLCLKEAESLHSGGDTQKKAAQAMAQKAAKLFESAAGMKALTPEAVRIFNLAKAQSIAGDTENAVANFNKVATMKQSDVSALWAREMAVATEFGRNSEEFRTRIADMLEAHWKSGAVDEYAAPLQGKLAVAYRRAGQFEKSTELFSGTLDKGLSEDVLTYSMSLIALNHESLGEKHLAKKMLEDLVEQYPDASGGQAAQVTLEMREKEAKAQQSLKESLAARKQHPKAKAKVKPESGVSSLRFIVILSGIVLIAIAIILMVRAKKRRI